MLKAATDGDRDEVESLLLQGANVNYTNEVRPLVLRIQDGNSWMLACLNVFVVLCFNISFHVAVVQKGYSSLIRACRMQRVEVVRQLLKYNPDVNLASKVCDWMKNGLAK